MTAPTMRQVCSSDIPRHSEARCIAATHSRGSQALASNRRGGGLFSAGRAALLPSSLSGRRDEAEGRRFLRDVGHHLDQAGCIRASASLQRAAQPRCIATRAMTARRMPWHRSGNQGWSVPRPHGGRRTAASGRAERCRRHELLNTTVTRLMPKRTAVARSDRRRTGTRHRPSPPPRRGPDGRPSPRAPSGSPPPACRRSPSVTERPRRVERQAEPGDVADLRHLVAEDAVLRQHVADRLDDMTSAAGPTGSPAPSSVLARGDPRRARQASARRVTAAASARAASAASATMPRSTARRRISAGSMSMRATLQAVRQLAPARGRHVQPGAEGDQQIGLGPQLVGRPAMVRPSG